MSKHRERIREISPLNSLGSEALDALIERAEFLELPAGETLFREGDSDQDVFYLLQGELKLSAAARGERVISDTSDRARYAIGNLQPRPSTAAIASSTALIMKADRKWIEDQVARSQIVTGEMPAVQVTDVAESEGIDGAWMFKIIQSEIFRDLPTENIEKFFAAVTRMDAKADDVIVKQGEAGDYYYMLVEGECTVSRKAGPVAFEIAELGPGDSFGEEALISGLPRNATITMKTDGVLMRLAKTDFSGLIKKPTIKAIGAKDAARQLKQGKAYFLDVRLENEHGAKSIRNSQNIPLYKLREELDQLDREKLCIAYCDTGARSSSAAFLLCQRGFEAVYLEGGLSALMPTK